MTDQLMFGFGGEKPENEDFPLEFTGHYLIGMNPKTEKDGGYWDTEEEAIINFAKQFSELAQQAHENFLFVRRVPVCTKEDWYKYRMIGRFSIAKLKEQELPPEWPLIKNILAEYGLDAISFVAEFKAAQRPWQGLTDNDWEWVADKKETSLDTFAHGAAWAADQLKERNT